jgi:hypothetical protein
MATVPAPGPADPAASHFDTLLVALRALCELVATGGPSVRSGAITVRLDADASGMALLRAAERIATECGVTERISLEPGRGTIHVARAG